MGPCAGALAVAAAVAAAGIVYLQLRPLPVVPERYLAPQSEAEWRTWAGQWQAHEQCQGADPLEPAVRAVPGGLWDRESLAGRGLTELTRRIKAGLADLPDESLPGSGPHGWDYGMQTPFLRELGARWLAALEPGSDGAPGVLEVAASAFPAQTACVAGLHTFMLRLDKVRLPVGAVRQLVKTSLEAARGPGRAFDQEALLAGPRALADLDAAAARLAAHRERAAAGKRPLLVLLHGWPSGPAEYLPVLRALASLNETARGDGAAGGGSLDAWIELDVVAPALPGFGGSAPALPRGAGAALGSDDQELWSLRRRGPDAVDLAHWLAAVPRALGYAAWGSTGRASTPAGGYFVAGGDYGGLVAGVLGQVERDPALLGVHLSMWPIQAQRPLTLARTALTALLPAALRPAARALGAALDAADTERFGNGSLASVIGDLAMQSGYLHHQATFPDTLAAALRGNPLGTAAWVLDKLIVWTAPCFRARGAPFASPGACMLARYPLAPALLMVHDHLRSVRAPLRLYRDALRSPRSITSLAAAVPARAALLSLEQETLFRVPFAWAGDKFVSVAQTAALPGSGHFAGLEAPRPLLADVLRFVVGTLAEERSDAGSDGAADEL